MVTVKIDNAQINGVRKAGLTVSRVCHSGHKEVSVLTVSVLRGLILKKIYGSI